MNIYRNNVVLSVQNATEYRIVVSAKEESREILSRVITILLLEKEWMLCLTDVSDSEILPECEKLAVYKEEKQLLTFENIEEVSREDQNKYRIFCDREKATLSEVIQARIQDEVKAGKNAETIELSDAQINASLEKMWQKYFQGTPGTLTAAERRRIRRQLSVTTSENTGQDILQELNQMIGLSAVKEQVTRMIAREQQKDLIAGAGIKQKPDDMLFLGNPGTGKTTVARILTTILYRMGKIGEDKCVEINGHSLTGGFIGTTAGTVEKYIKEASGGVLFIDEAYSLMEGSESFAGDAITKLLGALTKPNRDFVCFLAGYQEEMQELLNYNSGLRSRVRTSLDFENYNTEELGEILCRLLKEYHYSIEKEALGEILEYFDKVRNAPKFSNGRFVRNLFEKMEEEHCKYFDGKDASSDTFRRLDFTDTIKHELEMTIQ